MSPPAHRSPRRRRWLVRASCLGLVAVGIGAVSLGAFTGYVVGATEHPWHEGWTRAYLAVRATPGLRRLVDFVEARPPASAGPPGLWASRPGADLDDAQRAEMQRLAALGYLEAYEPPSGEAGVTVHDRERAWAGLNLTNSGHAPEALLLDMDGRVLHRWRLSFEEAFPGRRGGSWPTGRHYWRRVYLYENGDLLAIFEGLGLVKVDRDSRLLWARACGCHHDLYVDEADGTLFVLTREPVVDDRIHGYEPVLVDSLTAFDAQGREQRAVSLLDAFAASHYASLLHSGPPSGDVFHTNTVERLDGSLADRVPAFRAGSFLLSMRELDALAVLDPERGAITWALTGQWHRQHQPTMVEPGRILLLDNRGHHGRSKVIELDPATQAVAWSYLGDEDNGFSTRTSGSVQRLPNGNTLVTESDSGRAFEITRSGERVWEYNNPARGGEHGELVATLQEVQRLPADYVRSWLESPSP